MSPSSSPNREFQWVLFQMDQVAISTNLIAKSRNQDHSRIIQFLLL